MGNRKRVKELGRKRIRGENDGNVRGMKKILKDTRGMEEGPIKMEEGKGNWKTCESSESN